MRKLRLLLYAGTMAGALGGTAFALEFPPSNGTSPFGGPSPLVSGTGVATTASGFVTEGSAYNDCIGQMLSPTSACPSSSPFSTPAPGTVIMRIGIEQITGVQGGWWTGQNGAGIPLTPGTNPQLSPGGNKEAGYGIAGFFRIDFAMDGMAQAGVRYGVFSQVRVNTVGGQATVTSGTSSVTTAGTTGTGVGTLNLNTSAAGGTSADNSQNTLYMRNICTYIGTDAIGIFKIGQGSCVDTGSAFLTGLNDDIGWGGWDGGNDIAPGSVTPAWPWPDAGGDYMPAGVAYYSPVMAGVDFSASFAPNNSTLMTGTACTTNYNGCNTQSTANDNSDISRWQNRLELGLRYRNAIGPVGFVVSGVWVHSGQVQPGPNAVPGVRYNPMNYGIIGAEVSFNKYFAVGANTIFGAMNGAGAMQPKPGPGQSATTAIAWEAGAKFTMPNIPMTVGGSYYNFKYQGTALVPTQRVSQGIDLEATYGIGPGAVAFASYMWGQIYQGGVNLLGGGGAADLNNTVKLQLATAGLALQF